jgi:hypothetical protein
LPRPRIPHPDCRWLLSRLPRYTAGRAGVLGILLRLCWPRRTPKVAIVFEHLCQCGMSSPVGGPTSFRPSPPASPGAHQKGWFSSERYDLSENFYERFRLFLELKARRQRQTVRFVRVADAAAPHELSVRASGQPSWGSSANKVYASARSVICLVRFCLSLPNTDTCE